VPRSKAAIKVVEILRTPAGGKPDQERSAKTIEAIK
jgi:hypothetical protein